jgi:hypothetical protein
MLTVRSLLSHWEEQACISRRERSFVESFINASSQEQEIVIALGSNVDHRISTALDRWLFLYSAVRWTSFGPHELLRQVKQNLSGIQSPTDEDVVPDQLIWVWYSMVNITWMERRETICFGYLMEISTLKSIQSWHSPNLALRVLVEYHALLKQLKC